MTGRWCSAVWHGARKAIVTAVCVAALSSSAAASGAADGAQPLPSLKTTRAQWQLIKAAVRACVLGEHDLCQMRMSEISALLRGPASPGSPATPASFHPSQPSQEVRVGMFTYPTGPAFHQLRAIFKSGRCDPANGTWESAGPGVANDALRELFVAAEQQLADPRWASEREELHQIWRTMEACMAASSRHDQVG